MRSRTHIREWHESGVVLYASDIGFALHSVKNQYLLLYTSLLKCQYISSFFITLVAISCHASYI